jgi:hypothetical protein
MRLHRLAISAALAAGVSALPFAAAEAQYYYPCNPFPLTWPFCIAGAAVGTAAAIVTAPFRAAAGPYYYPQPGYAATYRGYSGGGHEPWNRPSPSDRVARQLNRQELARMRSGY